MQLLRAAGHPVDFSFYAERKRNISSRQRSARVLEEEDDCHVPVVVGRDPFLRPLQTVLTLVSRVSR